MTVKCCVCNLERVGNEWKHAQAEDDEPISHTYCPLCLESSLDQIRSDMQFYKTNAM